MNFTLGLFISILFPLCFWLLVLQCLKQANIIQEIKSISIKRWICILIFLLFTLLFVIVILKKDHFIYFWDYGREWTSAIQVTDTLFCEPINALKDIYITINSQDYNHFMQLLIALPLKVFGYSFTRYIAVVHMFYMIPAFIISSLLFYKVINNHYSKTISYELILLIVATTPIIYYVEFYGFMDAPVLILVSCLLLLSASYKYNKVQIKKNILMSCCMLLLILFRRHFAYFVIGFLVLMFFKMLFDLKNNENRVSTIKYYICNMLFIGILCLTILIVFFNGFLMQSVFNDFSIAYKAYDVSFREKLLRLREVFGIVPLVFMLVGSIIRNSKKNLKVYILLLSNIIITTLLLWRVLQMNYHQYYLIIIMVLGLIILAVANINNIFIKQINKMFFQVIIMCFCLINFSIVFIPRFNNLNKMNIFSSSYYEPKCRNDLEIISEIVNDLNILCPEGSDKMAYIASGTVNFNTHTISMSRMPYIKKAVPNMFDTHNIDLRDGFPTSVFDADVIVISTPVKYDDTQRILSYFTNELSDKSSSLSKHYNIYKEYQIDQNEKVIIYIRTSILDDNEITKIQKYFNEFYSDYPELFNDRIESAKIYFPTIVGQSMTISNGEIYWASEFERWKSKGAGYLVYGPRKKIDSGVYQIEFNISYNGNLNEGEDLGIVDSYINNQVISQKKFVVGDKNVVLENCTVEDIYDNAEFRMYVNDENVQLNNIKITKIN